MRFLFCLVALLASPAFANEWGLESEDTRRQRISAENYDNYRQRNRGFELPSAGYYERPDRSGPQGTEYPGYGQPRSDEGYRSDPFAKYR